PPEGPRRGHAVGAAFGRREREWQLSRQGEAAQSLYDRGAASDGHVVRSRGGWCRAHDADHEAKRLSEGSRATKVVKIFGQHDAETVRQLEQVAANAERVALMADGHVGYVMPIGGVAAYHNKASVVGVGFDIACGNAAIRTDLHGDDFDRPQWSALADAIAATVSFGIGRRNESSDAPAE